MQVYIFGLKRRLLTLLATVFLFLLFGCGTTSMMIKVKRPAEINLKGYDKIAIGSMVDATGRTTAHSNDLSDKITEVLFKSKRFDVLDRQHIDNLIKEHNLSISGLVDENSAAKLGKFIGSAVLIFGRIQKDKPEEELSKGDPWRDKKGNLYQNFYRTGQYILSANIKVVDVQTSKVLAIKNFSAKHNKQTSKTNGTPPSIDYDILYTQCLNDIANEFLKLVAPYTVMVRAEFETDSKLPEMKLALTQFKIGEWDEGVKILEGAVKKTNIEPKTRAKAFYNLGLAETYSGQFNRALFHLRKALSVNPNSWRYQKAIINAKEEKKKAKKLKEEI